MGTNDTEVLFRQSDGPYIQENGKPYVRICDDTKVFALRLHWPMRVEKASADSYPPGFYVLYSPADGIVWPCSSDNFYHNYKAA